MSTVSRHLLTRNSRLTTLPQNHSPGFLLFLPGHLTQSPTSGKFPIAFPLSGLISAGITSGRGYCPVSTFSALSLPCLVQVILEEEHPPLYRGEFARPHPPVNGGAVHAEIPRRLGGGQQFNFGVLNDNSDGCHFASCSVKVPDLLAHSISDALPRAYMPHRCHHILLLAAPTHRDSE